MKKTVSIVALTLLMMLTTSPPVEGKKKKPKEPPAFVFGSIRGVPGLKNVYIQKLGKVYVGNFNRPKTHVGEGGAFYFDKVPPGDYYLAGFSNRAGDLYWFRFTRETVKAALFQVETDQVTYMGSYRVNGVDKSFWTKRGKFEFERVEEPTENTLLETIVPLTRNTTWESKVGARAEAASR